MALSKKLMQRNVINDDTYPSDQYTRAIMNLRSHLWLFPPSLADVNISVGQPGVQVYTVPVLL